MQIGSLAKANGVSVQTVRYYERYGLLPKPQRKASSYRIYTDEHVRRLQFVLQAKTLAFTLDEIKEIISLSQRHECPCGRVVRIAEERLADISKQIDEISCFRKELSRALTRWKTVPQESPSGDAICMLIEKTMIRKGKSH